jgi:hypothetical protein
MFLDGNAVGTFGAGGLIESVGTVLAIFFF